MKKTFYFLLITLLFLSCGKDRTPSNYINKVRQNLARIKSATYTNYFESWMPGDTVASLTGYNYIEYYKNPEDTIIGASFISYKKGDSLFSYIYDGKMTATTYPKHHGIVIDSFKVKNTPYRFVSSPFYTFADNILEYILTTSDSIDYKLIETDSIYHLKLVINEDRQIEFHGKACYVPKNPYTADPTSRYEIWINKKTNMPYKILRNMCHQKTVQKISNIKFNCLNIKNFVASNYFPKNYEIIYKIDYWNRRNKRRNSPNKMIGEKALDWKTTDSYNKPVSLSNMKGKVVLMNFSTICCEPCRVSIPFLQSLAKKYKNAKFDFVTIENTQNNDVINKYKNRCKASYKFIKSNKDLEKYSIECYPTFYILDKNHIIKKVIKGYAEETTDKEIIETIDNLLKE